jgi:1-acyl-sn-glycerol-3-phosphate acyltransferase
MLPPRLVRRFVLAPLAVLIAIAVAVLFPLLACLALIFGLLGKSRSRRLAPQGGLGGSSSRRLARHARRMRSMRLLYFALIWLAAETAALFTCLGLWVVSGFGGRLRTEPYQSRHYAIMRRFLDRVYRSATATFGVRVEITEPDLTDAELASRLARPIIVLSRHAGPGDSFLLVRHLLSEYQRRPRIVMKATMQLDPGVDVVANRLPNVFIRHRGTGDRIYTEQIERLARGLEPTGALVIFPEGGNWTPSRWRRGVQRLEQLGRRDLAERARQMPNVLTPRSGGAFAAIRACPDADVIFVAHAGLDRLVGVRDIWHSLPMDQVIRARWWRVPVGEVPHDADHEAQLLWLYDWWKRIDEWISENHPDGAALSPPAAGGEAGPAPGDQPPSVPHGPDRLAQ